MKKTLFTITFAVIGLGIASASVPLNQQDTTKVKTKMAHHQLKQKVKGPTKKVKTKIKDTTKTT